MDTSKIIKGVVNSGRYTVTAPIVKEDYGLYLQIEGVELPQTYEVDFSNSEHNGTSVTMIGNSDGVLIPHQFISTGKDVFAFLYHVGANYGRTVYKFRIPNKVRPDRTNEQPTPEEQSVIDQAIGALNTAVAKTAQDVIDADASAQNASADAERAEEARTDAQNYATQAEQARDDAQTYANNASASATASANSASASAQIKSDVEDLVDDAQGYANASAQSASASANSASQAQGFAQSASASAQSASGYASSAGGHAQTASTKAQDASTSASTASQKATESAQSATNASQSAQTAESAKTSAQTAQGLAESARDSAVQAKTDVQNIADGIDTRLVDVENDVIKAFPTDMTSGSIASFTDGADNLPLKSLVVDINPVQDTSSGDPSPENICPISGWTGMELNVNGIVIPISWQSEAGTVYGGKLDVLTGKLTVTFVESSALDTLNWAYYASGRYFYAVLTKRFANTESGNGIGMWDRYKYFGNNTGTYLQNNMPDMNFGFTTGSANKYIYVKDSRFDNAADFKASLAGSQFICTMSKDNWVEIQLTPHEVNSLLGQNNIFADTGDTEVEYRADTKLFIERLTAPDSADMIADANIVSGQYFMVGNNLYKATANIANGAQIIVGTNCTRVSLAQALNEINA